MRLFQSIFISGRNINSSITFSLKKLYLQTHRREISIPVSNVLNTVLLQLLPKYIMKTLIFHANKMSSIILIYKCELVSFGLSRVVWFNKPLSNECTIFSDFS